MNPRLEQTRKALNDDDVRIVGNKGRDFETNIESDVVNSADAIASTVLRAVDVASVMLGVPYPETETSTSLSESWKEKFKHSAVLQALTEYRMFKSGFILHDSEESVYKDLMTEFCEINLIMGGLSEESLKDRSAHPVLRFSPDEVRAYYDLCNDCGIAPNVTKQTLLDNKDPVAWIVDFIDRTEQLNEKYMSVDGIDQMVITRLATRVNAEKAVESYLDNLEVVRQEFANISWLGERDLRFFCANYIKDPAKFIRLLIQKVESGKERCGGVLSMAELKHLYAGKSTEDADAVINAFTDRYKDFEQRFVDDVYITPHTVRLALLQRPDPDNWLNNHKVRCLALEQEYPGINRGIITRYSSMYLDPKRPLEAYLGRLNRLQQVNNGRARDSVVNRVAVSYGNDNYEEKFEEVIATTQILVSEFSESRFIRPNEIMEICAVNPNVETVRNRLKQAEEFLAQLNEEYPVEGIISVIIPACVLGSVKDAGKRAESIARTYNALGEQYQNHPFIRSSHIAFLLGKVQPLEVRDKLEQLEKSYNVTDKQSPKSFMDHITKQLGDTDIEANVTEEV